MTRTPKRPRDPNQLAKMVVDIATAEMEDAATQKRASATSEKKINLKQSAAAKKE